MRGEINDPNFFDLTHKLFSAGLVGGEKGGPSSRAPQGSVLSPLLCNIYSHKPDREMERIRQEHETPKAQGRESVFFGMTGRENSKNSGEEASFNSPSVDNKAIVGVKRIQRKAFSSRASVRRSGKLPGNLSRTPEIGGIALHFSGFAPSCFPFLPDPGGERPPTFFPLLLPLPTLRSVFCPSGLRAEAEPKQSLRAFIRKANGFTLKRTKAEGRELYAFSMRNHRGLMKLDEEARLAIRLGRRRLAREQGLSPVDFNDPDFIRIRYV